MSVEVDKARRKVEGARRTESVLKWVFVVYVIVVTIAGLIQQNVVLDQLRASNEELHAQTQRYIRCIGDALLLPLAVRDEAVFDRCGIDTTATQQAPAETEPSAPTPPEASAQVLPAPTVSDQAPEVDETTTSSPPDPEVVPPSRSTGFVEAVIEDVLSPTVDTLLTPVRALVGQ